MTKKRWMITPPRLFLSAVLCGVLLLSGCGKAQNEQNGYLNVAWDSTVKTLDNSLATEGCSLGTIVNCIDGLLNTDPSGKMAPGIAESYEVSEDEMTYIFHLRDAVWTNGAPVTADDFVYSWRRLAAAGESYSFLISDVLCIKNGSAVVDGDGNGNFADPATLGIYADDPRTLRLELENPVPFLPTVLGFGVLTPLNQEFYESLEEGMYGTSPETFLCNGAYQLESYIPGTTCVKLKKNELYWNKDAVKLPGVCFRIIGSENTAVQAFEVGDIDIVEISGNNIIKFYDSPCINRISSGSLTYLNMSQVPEQADGCFMNANLRHAFAHAIDKRSLTDNVLKDGSVPMNTFVPSGYAFSVTTGEDFSDDQSVYQDASDFNLEKAAMYFEKAKEELGRETFHFKLMFVGGGDTSNIAQMIQQQIEQNLPGVTIELDPVTRSEAVSKRKEHNFELYLSVWGPDYADPMTFLSLYRSGDSFNYGGWDNAEYTDIINGCISGVYCTDYELRWKVMKDAERILIEDAGLIPLYMGMNSRLIAEEVSGAFFPVTGSQNYKRAEKQIKE